MREFGPHGGVWIKTAEGYVEISVFETAVPPRFRLYFFDLNSNPVLPLSTNKIKIETLRPDGILQNFLFKSKHDYLEAEDLLPEPHEFKVTLNIDVGNHSHNYSVAFNEAEHDHQHSHAEHHHAHPRRPFARLRGIWGHSHDMADKIDASMESNALGIKTLKITLAILLVTSVFQLAIALLSGSVGLLADTIHNFGDATTSIPLWVAFALTRRGASRRFTYGYGKTEDVAGVVIVLIIFISACVAAYESIHKLMNPVAMDNLAWVTAAAFIGFIGNEAVAMYRIRVGKLIGSAAMIADGYHARVDGFTSFAVLFGVVGSLLGYPIVDSLVGIFITISILFIVKDTAKSVWVRLIDGIEPEILAEIEHAPTHIDGVSGVHDVRARWIGHKVYAEVTIQVAPNMLVSKADELAKKVEHSLCTHVRLLGGVTVRVRPDMKSI